MDAGSVRKTGDVGGADPCVKRVSWQVEVGSVCEKGEVGGGCGICSGDVAGGRGIRSGNG